MRPSRQTSISFPPSNTSARNESTSRRGRPGSAITSWLTTAGAPSGLLVAAHSSLLVVIVVVTDSCMTTQEVVRKQPSNKARRVSGAMACGVRQRRERPSFAAASCAWPAIQRNLSVVFLFFFSFFLIVLGSPMRTPSSQNEFTSMSEHRYTAHGGSRRKSRCYNP